LCPNKYLCATINTMLRITYFLAVIALSFLACNNNTTPPPAQEEVAGRQGHWYARYTGTVAGQPIVANLYFYADSTGAVQSVSGNYYYSGKSQLIDLSAVNKKDDKIHLSEYVQTIRDPEGSKKYPEWVITIDTAGIEGKWHSADQKTTGDILLRENYDGAYPFDVITGADSVTFKGKGGVYRMKEEHTMLIPSAKMNSGDAAFITQALLHELGGDTLGAKDFEGYIRTVNGPRFASYKATLEELEKDSDTAEQWSNNWESDASNLCVYNDKGLVVFNFNQYDYSGGAHGNNWSRYICLDVKERKAWRLADILDADGRKLSAMLEEEARVNFGIKPGEPLNDQLLVDTIPLTDNIIISDLGLTFHYNAYEVACYAEGEVSFFLSYAMLKEMLKPEFKTRMGLQ
jgi:hypothetical protein